MAAYQTIPGGAWIWLDNTTVSGAWQTGQPNGSTEERCLAFNVGGGDSGYSDFPCSSHFSYGCQIADPSAPGKSMLFRSITYVISAL